MESSGADGASEASYESVASEGAFEPASDRGRDPLPRIISASHCVDVYRRLRRFDGPFCFLPAAHQNGSARARGGNHSLRPWEPLYGMPSRLMRFDGALEAWLEELPTPKDPAHAPRPYAAVNDAARLSSKDPDLSLLRSGNEKATLWFFTLEFLQQLWPYFLTPEDRGAEIWQRGVQERDCTIQTTHVVVGRVDCPPASTKRERKSWLRAVFSAMQASKWTPNGEARSLIAERRLSHASMAVGDAIQIGSELWLVSLRDFVSVAEAYKLLPPGLDPSDREHLEDDEDSEPPAIPESSDDEPSDDESLRPDTASKGAGKKGRKNKDKKGRKGLAAGTGAAAAAAGTGAAAAMDAADIAEEVDGGGKGAKGKGRGERKGKGKGKGKAEGKGGGKSSGGGGGAGGEWAREATYSQQAKGAKGDGRQDRRRLRAQLQARREQFQWW